MGRRSRLSGTTLGDTREDMASIGPGLQFFGCSVDALIHVDELRAYLTTVEEFLAESATRLVGKHDAFGNEDSYLYEEPFPSILYSSVIVVTVGLLERDLRDFAQSLRDAENLQLSLRELRGSWLDRFLVYAQKVARMDLALPSKLLEDVRGVVEVRNCLVHNGGQLADFAGKGAVQSFIRRKALGPVVVDALLADSKLVVAVIDIVEQFLNVCFEAALRKWPRE